jgi:hypothetical protein
MPQELVVDSTRDTLLLFYSPWCDACALLKITFDLDPIARDHNVLVDFRINIFSFCRLEFSIVTGFGSNVLQLNFARIAGAASARRCCLCGTTWPPHSSPATHRSLSRALISGAMGCSQ